MQQKSIFNPKYRELFLIWISIAIAICGLALFYRGSISILFDNWNEYGTYSHGYLTILLSIFLLYSCAKQARIKYSRSSSTSAIFIFGITLVWLVSYVASVNTIQMLCLPFLIFFTVTYFLGLKNYQVLLIPIFILLFTIPVWSLFLPYLQKIAVFGTDTLLSVSNFDYRIVDNVVILSKGMFEIEESCSGLRYLLVGVLLSFVYGYLNYQSNWATIVLVLSAVVIMLVGNLFRILIIIVLGVWKGMDYPLVQDHENLGWLIFILMLVPLFTIARFIKPSLWKKTNQQQTSYINVNKNMQGYKLFVTLIIYFLIISAAPLYAGFIDGNIKKIATLKSNDIVPAKGWSEPLLFSSRWSPKYSFYTKQYIRQFEKKKSIITLNIYLYGKQDKNSELINSNNKIVDSNEWHVSNVLSDQILLDESEESQIPINKLTINNKRDGSCLRIWYWFQVGDRFYAKEWQVKLNEVLMSFKGVYGSAITSIAMKCDMNSDSVLEDFLHTHYGQLNNLISL